MNRNNAGNIRNYDFSRVPGVDLPRTRMFRPSSHKTTIGCDYLYPLYIDEVLPGDTFRLDVSTFARMTSALVPFMDNLYLDWQFFFVPMRLVWSNWQKFCGEQENPDDSIDYTIPYLEAKNTSTGSATSVAVGSIYDYFGIPTGVSWAPHDVSSLPFRAYNLIWNEWYRDENLQNSVNVFKDDGPDYLASYALLKRGKRKDYFTSCLPSPQKGPEVFLPVAGGTFPVRGNGMTLGLTHGTPGSAHNSALVQGGSDSPRSLYLSTAAYGQEASTTVSIGYPTNGRFGVTTDATNSGLVAEVSELGSVTINELRQAFQMQKFFERLNRGGTRYIEILKGMFGVTSPDARLQRPELLTSFTVPVELYQNVQSSASSDGSTPQGNLAANATVAGYNFAFSKSFVEHGYILGLCSIRSDLTYQQGLHRMWSRRTRYDFYWPTFAHLGEQAVLNKEIYMQNSSVVDANSNVVNDKVFGYQERWSEYKYGHNRISGELRSTYAQSLDVWHLAQKFNSLPTLNSSFIEENVPIARVLAIDPSVASPFVVDTAFSCVCVRPLPLYDVPGLVDHF